jgi:hypothetical protein
MSSAAGRLAAAGALAGAAVQLIADMSDESADEDDKTIVIYDTFIIAIKEGRLYGDVGFIHQWRCLQAVAKHASDLLSKRFAASGEAVRKDVECTFGIMKARHRILRGRISLSSSADFDGEEDKEEDAEDARIRARQDGVDYSHAGGGLSRHEMRAPEVCLVREKDPECHVLHDKLVENFEWLSKNGQVQRLK